jgi:hypothetical protein
MTTDMTIPQLTELEQRRQVLAFEVALGRDGAAEQLEAVEAQLAQLRRHQERQALVERERAVRAEAEAQAAQVAQRAELEAQLAERRQHQLEAAARVQEAVGPFRQAVEEYLAAGRAVYAATAALGRTPTEKLRGRAQLHQFLRAALGGGVEVAAPPAVGPREARQAPLVDLLTGKAYAGREAES